MNCSEPKETGAWRAGKESAKGTGQRLGQREEEPDHLGYWKDSGFSLCGVGAMDLTYILKGSLWLGINCRNQREKKQGKLEMLE